MKSIVHDIILVKFVNQCKNQHSNHIKMKDIKVILYNSHIPKRYHAIFLDEMKRVGYIEFINKYLIKVNQTKSNDSDWFFCFV